MTRVVRISRCLLSALFRRQTLSPAHHLCEHKHHTSTALATGGDGRTSKARTAAAAQRPPAAVARVLSPTWRTPRRLLWFGGGGRTLICGLLGSLC